MPVPLFAHKPERCPYGHSLAPGMPQKISWMPCICEPAREAGRQGRGMGHLTLWCGRCSAEDHRDTRFYEPPHQVSYSGPVSGWMKECIRDPAHFKAALGYYCGQFDNNRFGSEEWAAEQAAAWGRDITQSTLYLHGTQDGCHGMTQEQVDGVPQHCGPGSQSELIEGVGHFMMVQRPTDINKRIVDFLAT